MRGRRAATDDLSGTGHHQVPLVEGALGLGLSSTNETAEDRTWACEPLVNPEAVAGKYCVVDRGGCFFQTKVSDETLGRARAQGGTATDLVSPGPASTTIAWRRGPLAP